MTKALDPASLKSADRHVPEIDPARVQVQAAGQITREYFVRCPAGMVADDMKEPSIWRKVQASRNAFKKFDRVFIVSFDETWIAEAIVAGADNKSAVLGKPRIETLPTRYDKLFSDGTYKVEFNGIGFVVIRISDGHTMTQPTANAALAERLLVQMYPARAGQ
ncbi:MAG: hypothetical protein EOR47_14190 [Mesorhizobium sp.]|uniref:hypothetical protein n=1 Tax=Mesorhizobium sp. TaxID=1871066 RepID=UPI000FE95B9D|nr:hypothetical protein [Mesorhizobium sp.]RWK49423.1 MAG: hypothetical protein EOR47_14190 [Mesorhizobium sp.]